MERKHFLFVPCTYTGLFLLPLHHTSVGVLQNHYKELYNCTESVAHCRTSFICVFIFYLFPCFPSRFSSLCRCLFRFFPCTVAFFLLLTVDISHFPTDSLQMRHHVRRRSNILKWLDKETGNIDREHPVVPVPSCCSQQNVMAFNKQTEQCSSLSLIVNFFLFFADCSITTSRLMTSVDLHLWWRWPNYLSSKWKKDHRNILVFSWIVACDLRKATRKDYTRNSRFWKPGIHAFRIRLVALLKFNFVYPAITGHWTHGLEHITALIVTGTLLRICIQV